MITHPNYNLIRYEIGCIDRSMNSIDICDAVVDIYRHLVNRYIGHERELYDWFCSLSYNQLEKIYVRLEVQGQYRGFSVRDRRAWTYIIYKYSRDGTESYST